MGGYVSLQTATFGAVKVSALSPTVYAAAKSKGGGKEEETGDVVVIPVDQSQHAEAAFEWYMKHVHRPENTVHVVHCLEVGRVSPIQLSRGVEKGSDPNSEPKDEDPTLKLPIDFGDWIEFYEVEVEKASKLGVVVKQKYEDKLKQKKVKGDFVTDSGYYAGEFVCRTADKYGADMIVMGSRGFGVLRRTILGSVSHYVLTHTKVPVTIIPKEDKYLKDCKDIPDNYNIYT